jgi:SHS2 domain-containing protein
MGSTATARLHAHRALPHTADTGFEAVAPQLTELFEEAAAALAELAADVAPAAVEAAAGDVLPPDVIELGARDLAALAFAWLNELIGRSDARRQALVRTNVEALAEDEGAWRLRGRAWFGPYDGLRVRRRTDVKSATYHGLEVAPLPDGGWRLTAYLDV